MFQLYIFVKLTMVESLMVLQGSQPFGPGAADFPKRSPRQHHSQVGKRIVKEWEKGSKVSSIAGHCELSIMVYSPVALAAIFRSFRTEVPPSAKQWFGQYKIQRTPRINLQIGRQKL
jgi:hypothetical protein